MLRIQKILKMLISSNWQFILINYKESLISHSFTLLKRICLICFLLLITLTVQAQRELTLAQGEVNTNINKGFWRLKTEAATRRTQIQFFGINQQLLYEETLPEKVVKFSRSNQMQLDKFLNQLLTNQLLATRIKTKDLPPISIVNTQSSQLKKSGKGYATNEAFYKVHAYVDQAGKLQVLVDNPNRLRYTVKVFDSWNRLLYEEFGNRNKYKRGMNISTLPTDTYQVIVKINKQSNIYKLNGQTSKGTYTIKPLNSKLSQAEIYSSDFNF